MKRALHRLALVLGSIAFARVASAADNPQNAQLAQALFDEAKRLMAQRNYADACPKLVESQRLDPSGGTLLHLGICHASEGKTASAYAELNEALSMARRDRRDDREKVAKAHLAAVAQRLVRLTIAVSAQARVDNMQITWNGTPLPEPQWNVAFPVDPGDHVVVATAPGRRSQTLRAVVDANSRGGVTVTIPTLVAETAEPPPPPPIPPIRETPPPVVEPSPRPVETPPPVTSNGSGQRMAGIGVAATGVLALGVAGAFELRSLSLASERDDAAAAGDATGVAEKHDAAKSSQLAAMILGGIGLVAVGSGAVLYFTAKDGSTPAPARGASGLVPWLGPGGGGLHVRGSF